MTTKFTDADYEGLPVRPEQGTVSAELMVMGTPKKLVSDAEREEAARAANPRKETFIARPALDPVDLKEFHAETVRRFPEVMKYLGEH